MQTHKTNKTMLGISFTLKGTGRETVVGGEKVCNSECRFFT